MIKILASLKCTPGNGLPGVASVQWLHVHAIPKPIHISYSILAASYSLETSRPKILDFIQSTMTRVLFRHEKHMLI